MKKKVFYWFLFFMLIAAGIVWAQDQEISNAHNAAITMTDDDDNLSITSNGSITFIGSGIGIDFSVGNRNDAGNDILLNEGNITITSST